MSMKIISLLPLLMLALEGCSATAHQTHGPNGDISHVLECSKARLSWADCFEMAGEICREKGYIIINKSDQAGFVYSTHIASSVMYRVMQIQCNNDERKD